jgi:hypothetical protein
MQGETGSNTPRNVLLILCVIFGLGCGAPQAQPRSRSVPGVTEIPLLISWLPTDTETLLVANGPFVMSNFWARSEDYKNREVTSEEVEKYFEGLTLSLFNSNNGLLEKHLDGARILLAVEASRHFRSPAGLGELPYEGCAIAFLEEDLADRRDAFMREVAQAGARVEEIEGHKVAVFQEQREQDTWTTFVTFPQDRMVLAATNERFLREMLARMGGEKGERALPDNLPEWKHVNQKAQFWGLRHFDRRQANEDPTSPFGGRKSANFPDDAAIGLAYECTPAKERKATLTYLSGAVENIRKIDEARFPSSGEPGATGLHIQYRELELGAIQSTYELSHSEPLDLFLFVFMAYLGHAVYV